MDVKILYLFSTILQYYTEMSRFMKNGSNPLLQAGEELRPAPQRSLKEVPQTSLYNKLAHSGELSSAIGCKNSSSTL